MPRPWRRFVPTCAGLLLFSVVIGLVLVVSAKKKWISTTTPNAITLSSLAEKRIQRDSEWRDTHVLPAGVHQIPLGNAGDDAATVRLVFTPQTQAPSPPRATIFAGDQKVATINAVDPTRFIASRIDVSHLRPTNVNVLFESEVPLYIATCSITANSRPKDGENTKLLSPNILVFLIDTLRPDHLGCYGYARATSPNIDAMAQMGVRFTSMISQSSWTRPAVASLLTSTYAEVHGAKDRADVMRQDLATLAGVLKSRGYQTLGFMSNPSCLPMWGIGNDFARYVDVESYDVKPGKDAKVVDAAIAALDDVAHGPWFFYIHAIGPHSPYNPPPPFDGKFHTTPLPDGQDAIERARMADLYDGEIAFTDAQFGRLMDALKARNLLDDTLVVVLSDHGEEMSEHGGWGHGSTLFDEQIRIPCIVKLPNQAHAPTVREGITEIIDVAPTLLDYAGVAVPQSFQGRSLRPSIEDNVQGTMTAFSSLFLEAQNMSSARSATSKFIQDNIRQSKTWFDLRSDPGEMDPLNTPPETGEGLEQYAARIVASGEQGLHILVTGSLREPHTVSGRVASVDISEPRLQYAAKNGDVRIDSGALAFSVTTAPGPGSPLDIVEWHEKHGVQNNAHITAKTGLRSPLVISVQLDGATAPESLVFVGKDMKNVALNDTTIDPKELLAGPEMFDPAQLPRRLAIYIWYVPPADAIHDEDLDPDMVEALKALGYR